MSDEPASNHAQAGTPETMPLRADRPLRLQDEPVHLERRREVALPLPKAFALELTVLADPDALAGIRHALGGMAGALGMDPAGIADLRLALTEVCSAAVRRAGEDPTKELGVRAELDGDRLRVVIADGPELTAGAAGPEGFPLPLVAALTETLELRRTRGGAEVVMTFALRS